ncbi:hypothetical protein L1887_02914 [Cichorium endivia]|nr:hypothetical protein L1887_02914 [Cichorium endivia]
MAAKNPHHHLEENGGATTGYQLRFLEQPDDFYFNYLKPSILRSREAIKTLINADHVDEISIVDNATTVAAIVLQQVKWSFFESKFNPGDTAMKLHYVYGAIKKYVQAYNKKVHIQTTNSRTNHHQQHHPHIRFLSVSIKEKELEDPSTKKEMKAMYARALWFLCAGNLSICLDVTESRALLCFTVLIEKGEDEVQY